MFSGIVESTGTIKKIEIQDHCQTLEVLPFHPMNDLKLGDSISINGVCLTITQLQAESFQVNIVPQTLRVTNLGQLKVNDQVNLERALTLNERIGGHFVQGHIDQTGEIIHLEKDGEAALLAKIRISEHLSKYIVNKGYITIDGMSITIIEAESDWFNVTLIPYTQKVTIANQYKTGTLVNIEVDMMGKYIEKQLKAYSS